MNLQQPIVKSAILTFLSLAKIIVVDWGCILEMFLPLANIMVISHVNSELDSKNVVDKFHTSKDDVSSEQ